MLEFQPIKDLEYEYNADLGLSYASPVRGVWNIVHIGTLVPQAHEIYVCPTSCLRGVVLTTAEMGAMDRLSTITVGEDNILEGDMEEALQRGTERIIAELPERPRAMLIFTSCVHHFLAVNYQRVYRVLREKYPDIDFIDCYMDPIMRRTKPAIPNLWQQIHRLLKPVQAFNKQQVNYVGNCFGYGEYCDLTQMLLSRGITVKQLQTCKDYDDFLEMANSAANITFHKTAVRAAKDMEIRLGQKWLPMRPGCSYEEFDEDLRTAAEFLGIAPPTAEEITEQRKQTEEAVRSTCELLAGTPVSVDYTAVDRPLETAQYLIDHGFNVESVFVDVFTESREVFERLQKTAPDLKIYQSLGWNIRRMDRTHGEGKLVAIGQKSAYFKNTNHFVNIIENEGMYGYRGIRRLMELLSDAYLNEKPMRELVQIKGWGCCGE